MDKQIVVYEGEKDVRLEVKTDGETVWLTQEQMCRLFGRTQPVIARHITNVFKEGELPKEGFMQILHKTSPGGGRPVAIYNLDVVISRLDEIKRIAKLERRMDAAEGDIKQIKGGMNYLVQQLSAPPDTPRRRIGFGGDDDASAKPYGKKG